MIRSRSRSVLFGIFLICALTGCAQKPWDDPIEVSQLVRIEPKDFRVRAVIPPGLGETGSAYFHWSIVTLSTQEEKVTDLGLVREGAPVVKPDGTTEVVYRLAPSEYKSFQTQQIRQRAQLLADYYILAVAVLPDLCRMAGVDSRRDYVVSVLFDGQTGHKITTVRLDIPADAIRPQVAFCV